MTEAYGSKQEEIRQGLTEEMVKKRYQEGLDNEKVASSTQSVKKIIKSNVFTYFNLIFLVITILLVSVGSFRDLTFLPIIVANTLIGIIQELRSKQVLDQMNLLNTPFCHVIREGKIKQVPPEKLVRDDLVVLSGGEQIPADAKIVSGSVMVNESLLTGESDEISKGEGDSLLSGSFIVNGSCQAKLVKVGKESYISKLILQATASSKEEQSEMIRSLNRLVQGVGAIILPIGIILFVQQYFLAEAGLKNSITSMVAAIIGMIPEGLYLLASVAMAVSVMRLAKQKVLVHDMKCIETLARVDVLCVDKTGTITLPDMEVEEVILAQNESPVMGLEDAVKILSHLAAVQNSDNDTMKAIQKYCQERGNREIVQGAQLVVPFSSAYKYCGAVFGIHAYVMGAPEFVMKETYETIRQQVEEYSSKGYRVLLLGECGDFLPDNTIGGKVDPIAFLLLSNAIRKGAQETFSYFAKAGVSIKVISGDNPRTVSEIAQKAGIEGGENYIDATTLHSPEEIAAAVNQATVLGRVTPSQKRAFINALKDQGHTVAMTGDGVNDVLALKDADCGIALASGSQAACQVAQLVLMDNQFARMPAVVMEGRRVVNNIQRTASLYLVKNIFSMLLAVFSMIFMLNYPLEPSQVSLISMFTIGIPSFVLALEPNKELIRGRFMKNVLLTALPAGLTDFLVVSSLVWFTREFKVDSECVSTSCTILVAIVGFMILYRIAKPMTKGHGIMIIGLVAGWLYCMLFISHLFAITSITRQCAMLMVVFAIITEPCLRYLSLLVDRLKRSEK